MAMKKTSFHLIPLLAAMFVLSACGTTSIGTVASDLVTVASGGTVASVAPVTLGDAEKVLTISHNVVNYAGVQLIYNSTEPPAGSGLLHGKAATDARAIYDKAVDVLKIGDQADAVANTAGILDAVGQVQGLVGQFNALGLAAPPGVTPPATH